MYKEIQDLIFQFLGRNPLLVPFAGFFAYYLKNSYFRSTVNKFVLKVLQIMSNRAFLAHDLFFNVGYFHVQVGRVKFYNKIKTEMFRIILHEKIDSVIRISKAKLKENYKRIKAMSPVEIITLFMEIVNEIVEDYEKNILAKFQTNYGLELGREAFNLVYVGNSSQDIEAGKNLAFKPLHYRNNVAGIEKKINRLGMTSSKNIDDAVRSFLFELLMATDNAIMDCEESFESFNGGLEDLICRIIRYKQSA